MGSSSATRRGGTVATGTEVPPAGTGEERDPAAAAALATGATASKGPRTAAGLERLQQAAEAGDAEAMYLLGVAHAQGRLVERDEAQAARWFAKAVQGDHLQAKVSLGYCWATGRGVPRDLRKAYILLREAADAGEPRGFQLAEKVAQRLHGEVLRRCEREIRRRRILRAGRRGAAPPAEAARPGGRSDPPGTEGEEVEIIEIEVPGTGD